MIQTNAKKILVVDDDPTTLSFLHALLTGDGHEVETADNGTEALEMLKSDSFDQFDLVILDLMMPNYDGYEVLRELQHEEYQTVPIVIVTARTLDESTIEMIRAESNVHEFMKKPIDPRTFRMKVKEIMAKAVR